MTKKYLTPKKVRSLFVERGTSLNKWAIQTGFNPRTVNYAVNYWAGREDEGQPTGIETRKVLKFLSRELGISIHPSCEI